MISLRGHWRETFAALSLLAYWSLTLYALIVVLAALAGKLDVMPFGLPIGA